MNPYQSPQSSDRRSVWIKWLVIVLGCMVLSVAFAYAYGAATFVASGALHRIYGGVQAAIHAALGLWLFSLAPKLEAPE